MTKIKGIGVALITPFKEDKSIDVKSLEKIVHYVIEQGVDYLVPLGTTSECPTLSQEEQKLALDIIIEANSGRIPLVLGVGGNCTRDVLNRLEKLDPNTFEAVLAVTPYYNRPTQNGLYSHYKTLSENTEIPIVLYNVPLRTGVNLSPKTTLKLAHNFDNIIAIKEASPDFKQTLELIGKKPKDFLVISGDDTFALPTVLSGGDGVITVIGNAYPKEFSKMINLGLERKIDSALSIHYTLSEIIDYIFEESNPPGIKYLMNLKGLCKPDTRLPLSNITPQLELKIKKFFESYH